MLSKIDPEKLYEEYKARDDIKKIGSAVRRKLLSYLETADVYQLVNIESLSDELQDKLYKGQELMRLLNQRKFSPISQDRLVELFGYTVGMGESTAVKELLKYVEKSNEIDSGDSLVKKSNVKKTFVKKDNPVVQENKVEEPKVVEPVKPVEEPKEEKISLDQMVNDDSLEINFFQSTSEVDSDFDKNKFSNTNSTSGPVVSATPVVSTPTPVAPVAPAVSTQAPAAPVAPAVSTPAPVAPVAPAVSTQAPAAPVAPALSTQAPAASVAPVVSTPVQTAVQPVAPVQSVQEIK